MQVWLSSVQENDRALSKRKKKMITQQQTSVRAFLQKTKRALGAKELEIEHQTCSCPQHVRVLLSFLACFPQIYIRALLQRAKQHQLNGRRRCAHANHAAPAAKRVPSGHRPSMRMGRGGGHANSPTPASSPSILSEQSSSIESTASEPRLCHGLVRTRSPPFNRSFPSERRTSKVQPLPLTLITSGD